MTKLMGLFKRGSVYQYRRWIPSDLHDQFGYKEIKRSLKTTDYATATERVHQLLWDIEQQIANARVRSSNGVSYDPKLFPNTAPNANEPASKPPLDSDLNVSSSNWISDQVTTIVETVVERVLSSLGHHTTKPSAITITELFEQYMADPAVNRSTKTTMEYHSCFTLLAELVGAETSITEIDRTTCRQVMDTLRHLPPHATKRFPDKTWQEVSAIARDRSLKPLSPASINKYLNQLSALFNWAVKEELLDRNPAKGLAVADTIRAKDKRLPFSDDQLHRIFSERVRRDLSRYWWDRWTTKLG